MTRLANEQRQLIVVERFGEWIVVAAKNLENEIDVAGLLLTEDSIDCWQIRRVSLNRKAICSV